MDREDRRLKFRVCKTEMGWVSEACGTFGGQKSTQPCMSAEVEEAEQWDEEE